MMTRTCSSPLTLRCEPHRLVSQNSGCHHGAEQQAIQASTGLERCTALPSGLRVPIPSVFRPQAFPRWRVPRFLLMHVY